MECRDGLDSVTTLSQITCLSSPHSMLRHELLRRVPVSSCVCWHWASALAETSSARNNNRPRPMTGIDSSPPFSAGPTHRTNRVSSRHVFSSIVCHFVSSTRCALRFFSDLLSAPTARGGHPAVPQLPIASRSVPHQGSGSRTQHISLKHPVPARLAVSAFGHSYPICTRERVMKSEASSSLLP